MDSEFLFVYGTLRRDYGLSLMREVADEMEFVATGQVLGQLYDLGDYPGAVKLDQALTVIKGDVFQLKDSTTVFRLLDQYEGEEYRREKVVVDLDTGGQKEAWIYWFTGPAEEGKRIRVADYLDYLKNKKDRFL